MASSAIIKLLLLTKSCVAFYCAGTSPGYFHQKQQQNGRITLRRRRVFHCNSLYASNKKYDSEGQGSADNNTDDTANDSMVNHERGGHILFQDDEELFLQLMNQKQNEENDNPQEHEGVQISSSSSSPLPSGSISMLFSDDNGAGVPRASLQPGEIAPLLMTALQKNDFPQVDSGLTSMWEFSTDVTKYIFENNITEFIESCHETADEFPTSFYGAALNGKSWEMITDINMVGGNNDNCWIATQIMKTISSDGRMRHWQWEFRKNRIPPCLGCWKVETIASSDRQGNFQTEGRGTGWED